MAKKKMAKKKPTGAAAIKTVEGNEAPAASGAKKPGDRGFISEAIRAFDEATPGVGPTEAAKTLTDKFKVEFSPTMVSNVRAAAGNKKAKGKPGRKAKDASGAGNSSPKASGSSIEAAMTLVTTAGGIEAAKEALKTLEAFAKTVNG